MSLKRLLSVQFVYCLLGVGYNLASYLQISAGSPPLSATPPLVGGISMFVYGICLTPGIFGAVTVYRVLMGLAIIVYGYGGIVKHLINFYQNGLIGYSSLAAWAIAIGCINPLFTTGLQTHRQFIQSLHRFIIHLPFY